MSKGEQYQAGYDAAVKGKAEGVPSADAKFSAVVLWCGSGARNGFAEGFAQGVADAYGPEDNLWAWQWVGGGYNSCDARTYEEAKQKAKEMGGNRLRVDLSTLRTVTREELAALHASYELG